MECDDCPRLERLFLESMVFADKAETTLRCYFLTHQHSATVSDLAEYMSLRSDQQRTADERHRAFTLLPGCYLSRSCPPLRPGLGACLRTLRTPDHKKALRFAQDSDNSGWEYAVFSHYAVI